MEDEKLLGDKVEEALKKVGADKVGNRLKGLRKSLVAARKGNNS